MTTAGGRTVTALRPAAAVAAAALALAACSSPPAPAGHSGAAVPAVTVRARSLPGAGTVLVTSSGYALYMFEPDARRQVTCTGLCAATWPPLKIAAGAGLSAGPGVRGALLGSDPDPAGGRVVTYDGWPLYLYIGDKKPGQATGQALDLNGGLWYVIAPSGKVVKTKSRS